MYSVLCVLNVHMYVCMYVVQCCILCTTTHKVSIRYATAHGDKGGISQILVNEETEKREAMNRPSGANSRIESCTE